MTTNHEHKDFLLDVTCGALQTKGVTRRCLLTNIKASGWGTTLSKTHDMPKKSRVAFDCVYFQRSCNLSNLERISLLQEQVAVTLLDARNMPDLNCIPINQYDQAWALLYGMVIAEIDEVKNSDASTDVNDSIEDVKDFLVTASAAAPVNSIDLSSAEMMIADREIKIWQTRTVPFPKDKNPLDE